MKLICFSAIVSLFYLLFFISYLHYFSSYTIYLFIDLFIKQIKTNTFKMGEGGVTIKRTINCTQWLYQRLLFSLERSFIRKYDLICLL